MSKWLAYILFGVCLFLWRALPESAGESPVGQAFWNAAHSAGRAMPVSSAVACWRCVLPEVGERGHDGIGCALHAFTCVNRKGAKPAGHPDAAVRGIREGLPAAVPPYGRRGAGALAASFVKTGRYYVFALRRILV